MKKRIIIFISALTVFSLMAFSYMNFNGTEEIFCNKTVDLNNDLSSVIGEPAEIDLPIIVDSRFMNTITKENLQKATSVVDIVPKESEWSKVSFQNMTVAIIHDWEKHISKIDRSIEFLKKNDETRETGVDQILNSAQLKLLQSAEYSTNFSLKGKGVRMIGGPNGLKDNNQTRFDYASFITVVPEKEAEYSAGYDALISYLKENSKAATASIRKGTLQPGKVAFTVSKDGSIKYVALELKSGYSILDQAIMDLITNTPENWEPAENSKGEKVDQELVISYGRVGC